MSAVEVDGPASVNTYLSALGIAKVTIDKLTTTILDGNTIFDESP